MVKFWHVFIGRTVTIIKSINLFVTSILFGSLGPFLRCLGLFWKKWSKGVNSTFFLVIFICPILLLEHYYNLQKELCFYSFRQFCYFFKQHCWILLLFLLMAGTDGCPPMFMLSLFLDISCPEVLAGQTPVLSSNNHISQFPLQWGVTEFSPILMEEEVMSATPCCCLEGH